MSRRVDHSFGDPALRVATIAWTLDDGDTLEGQFGVLANEEDVHTVAKICFVSWNLGPGVPMKMGHGKHDD